MALRNSFLVSAALLTFAFVATVACSSDDSNSNGDSNTTDPNSATSTATSTATQTSTSAVSTNTAATTASANTATNTRTSTASTTATSGGASTTGGATTGDGATSSNSSSATAAGGAGGSSSASGTTGGGSEFTLTSPAFAFDGVCSDETPATCELFPSANSSFVDNESPELNWTAGPEGTLSYALVFHDTSNGIGHWAVWGLAGDVRQLPAALPGDPTLTSPVAQQVNASFAQGNGYYGPGSCENVYEFKLYALNVEDYTPQSATSPDTIQDELEGRPAECPDEEPDCLLVLDTVILRGRANPEDALTGGQNCN